MRRVDLVVMGASLGGLAALEQVLSKLPADLGVPIAIAQHRRADDGNRLAHLLSQHCAMPVSEPEDKEPLAPNRVFLAPADYHLLIDGDLCALSTDERIWYARPAIDVLFESASESYGARVASVLMTGSNQDGAEGTRAIKRHGGIAIVEDPLTALCPVAPRAALALTAVDHVVPLDDIPQLVIALCHGPEASLRPEASSGPEASLRPEALGTSTTTPGTEPEPGTEPDPGTEPEPEPGAPANPRGWT